MNAPATRYTVPTVVSERHFFRCLSCLHVFAIYVDALRGPGRTGAGFRPIAPACDCGDKTFRGPEHMGRVEGESLSLTVERCACDSRCTHAPGPRCSCSCGGKNHGTGRTVLTTTVAGVPTIIAGNLEERRAIVAEWHAAKAAARARAAKACPAIDEIAAGKRVDSYDEWTRARDLLKAIRKAAALKVHASRMAALAKVAP